MAERDKEVEQIRRRRDESAKWFDENYYSEFEEVLLAARCKTEPITVKNEEGNEVEDTTRTNVAMPDLAAIIRRNTARMTAQPPSLRFICRNNIELAERLTAWANWQYDRSNEDRVMRLHVQQAETFGISYTKLTWDKATVVRPFRRYRDQVKDRRIHLLEQGLSPEEADAQVAQLGAEMNDDELAQAVATRGSEIVVPTEIKKYEGPVVRFVFVGDLYPEPGMHSLNECNWVVESYTQTDRWLKQMATMTYVDPHSGGEINVFDQAAVTELLERGNSSSRRNTRQSNDLRTRLREATGMSEVNLPPSLLRGKRFDILEQHEMREDGRIWITWVSESPGVKLGEMPYLHDLGGRFLYTEYVPMPDLLYMIGDSTPRLGRFLYYLHNKVVNQRTDLVDAILRRVVFRRHGADIPDEAVERAAFRIYDVKDPNDFVVQSEPDVPASAWESEAAVMRQLGMLDGILNSVETGSNLNPMGGKTATTAVLAQRQVDTMTAAKLAALNGYLKDVNEKKLLMLQQQLQEAIDVPLSYAKSEVLIQRYGEVAAITIDPIELQEDIEVEPEAGSTLAVDDEFRRMGAVQAYQLAEQDPVVWNKYEVAKLVARTLRGCDESKVINPPAPPPPPPPKGSVALSIKFIELPIDTQQEVLQMMGLSRSAMLDQQAALQQKQQELQHAVTGALGEAVAGAPGSPAEKASKATPPSGPGQLPEVRQPIRPIGGVNVNSTAETLPSQTLADQV